MTARARAIEALRGYHGDAGAPAEMVANLEAAGLVILDAAEVERLRLAERAAEALLVLMEGGSRAPWLHEIRGNADIHAYRAARKST